MGGRSKPGRLLWRYGGKGRILAETEGFEPSVPLPVRRFSKPLVSATHPRLRRLAEAGL